MSAAFSVDALSAALSQLVSDAASARYCVAFSGGIDSTALLYGLCELRRSHPQIQLRALHVNHHLYPEADAWAAHCGRVAERLAVPFKALDAQVETGPGISTEAAAREARYALFLDDLQEGELLLTAHHQDDQLETVLLQLLRGAGVAGLSAMPGSTQFGRGLHLRPLLRFTRRSLEEFVRGTGLAWVEDSSNASLDFDRNYLRHRVLPLLLERWPSAPANVARTAVHLAEAQALLEELARQDLAGVRDGEALSVAALRGLDPPRARNLLRYWIREAGVRPPSTVKLQEILRQMLEARADANPCVDWDGVEVSRRRGRIHLQRRP